MGFEDKTGAGDFTEEVYTNMKAWVNRQDFPGMLHEVQSQFDQVKGNAQETVRLSAMMLGSAADVLGDWYQSGRREVMDLVTMAKGKLGEGLARTDVSNMMGDRWLSDLMNRPDDDRLIDGAELKQLFDQAKQAMPEAHAFSSLQTIVKSFREKWKI